MDINIENRLVVICGPTTSGKTTLTNRIKKEFSGNCKIIAHDDIISRLPKFINEKAQSQMFMNILLQELYKALDDESIDLIVLESIIYLMDQQLMLLLDTLEDMDYCDRVTLIKMHIPIELQIEYCQRRKKLEKGAPTMDVIANQDAMFYSPYGTLNRRYHNCDEFVVENPEELTLDIRPRGSKKF